MKSINVLVIGKNSLLAKCFKKYTKISNVKYINYNDYSKININKFTHIINFSIDKKNFTHDYSLTNKIDRKICKKIKNKNSIYIFPSSRLVYDKSKKNIYGRNKKKTENDIKSLKEKYLILRITTLLTYDTSNRNLFISRILRSLRKNNTIQLDISKKTYKDFITSEDLIYIIDNLINHKITGIYNISSNIKIKVIDILKNIINGYGSGKVIYLKKNKKRNSFLVNNDKLKNIIKFKTTKKKLLNYCVKLGIKLNA